MELRGAMSGGSYDYLYYKIEDAGRQLVRAEQPEYRRAFGQLLLKCAAAMHDVEWVDSSDYGPGDDKKAIMQCINPDDILRVSVEHAEAVMDSLVKTVEDTRQYYQEKASRF